MSFFSYFPRVRYNGLVAINLLLRVKVIKEVLDRKTAYYEYLIPEGETPDVTAFKAYGDSNLDWVIYLANEKYDPYTDWPLTYSEFNAYMELKYSKPVFETKSDIAFYRYTGIGGESSEDIARKSWTLSIDTFDALTPEERSGWTPVYVYDYESGLNDEKRRIRILRPEFIEQIKSEIEGLL